MFKKNSKNFGRRNKLKSLFNKKNLYIEHVLKCETKPKFSNDFEGFRARYAYNLETSIKNSKNKNDIAILKKLLKQVKLEIKQEQIKSEVSIKPEINKNLKKINVVKKEKIEKSPFILNVPTKNHSRLVYWCNPFEPINKGKLGTTQGWRKEEKFPQYY